VGDERREGERQGKEGERLRLFIDLDMVRLRDAVGEAERLWMIYGDLGDATIKRSSRRGYHIIFSKELGYHRWMEVLLDSRSGAYYAFFGILAGRSTLRISRKRGVMEPRVVRVMRYSKWLRRVPWEDVRLVRRIAEEGLVFADELKEDELRRAEGLVGRRVAFKVEFPPSVRMGVASGRRAYYTSFRNAVGKLGELIVEPLSPIGMRMTYALLRRAGFSRSMIMSYLFGFTRVGRRIIKLEGGVLDEERGESC